MKTTVLRAWAILAFTFFSLATVAVRAADTNPPPRLTVELRDGSRVVGTSAQKKFAFHSALLGDLKLAVAEIRTVEFTATNTAKLVTTGGDALKVSFADAEFSVKTGFGKVELPVNSIRRILVTTAGRLAPTRPGLLAFWSGDGNANDSAGQHDGVLMGGANFAPGPLGQAFNFDVPGSFVKIPKSDSLNPSGQVTVEFWMNAAAGNAMNNYQGLVTSDFYGVEISNGYGGQMGVNFFISTTASQPGLRFGFGDQRFSGFRSRITSVANFTHISDANGGGAPVAAGGWHHVAATYDGEQLRLYIDGQPWGNPVQRPGVIAPMLPESFVAIGSEDGRTTCPDCVARRYFTGLISGVAIYNRALSGGEIHEDCEAGKAN